MRAGAPVQAETPHHAPQGLSRPDSVRKTLTRFSAVPCFTVVLRNAANVLHVRLVAPLALRVRRVQQTEGLTEDAARKRVTERDRASRDYVRRFYNADAADPLLYDLVLTMHRLAPTTAAELIITALGCLAAPRVPEPLVAVA